MLKRNKKRHLKKCKGIQGPPDEELEGPEESKRPQPPPEESKRPQTPPQQQ